MITDFKENDQVMRKNTHDYWLIFKVVKSRDPDNQDNFIARRWDSHMRRFHEATESVPYLGTVPFKRTKSRWEY